ncbi:MAG: dihydroneopterin aldolase [Armatimonadota bacterium]|nr:dihydroneopterin aldolase [Armatimonadota bacterium]
MADRITLSGMKFFGRHGLLPSERSRGQRFLVDVEVETDLGEAGRTDALSKTLDYRKIYAATREVAEGPPFSLIEAVAEAIASRVLVLPRVHAVTVRVRKPEVVLGGPLEAAMVEVRRTRTPA